jgi:hypothetical protein
MIAITGSTSNFFDCWSCIELIYEQTSNITYAVWPSPAPEKRIYKVVFSCKDGKWHKSDEIYGKIIPAQEEYYEFED